MGIVVSRKANEDSDIDVMAILDRRGTLYESVGS